MWIVVLVVSGLTGVGFTDPVTSTATWEFKDNPYTSREECMKGLADADVPKEVFVTLGDLKNRGQVYEGFTVECQFLG